jgi:signal peptidase I
MQTVGKERLEDSYRFRVLRSLLIIIVAVAAITWFATRFLFSNFYIPSASMETTLNINDRVVVQKFDLNNIHRGDVIVFADPDNWLAGEDVSDGYLVKRVIGLPGDTVACCDAAGRVQVNGVGITEPYVKAGEAPSQDTFSQAVPAGELWVMGDNRDESADSRYHTPGFVPISKVYGKVVAVYYPFDKAHFMTDYSGVFASVPGAKASASN